MVHAGGKGAPVPLSVHRYYLSAMSQRTILLDGTVLTLQEEGPVSPLSKPRRSLSQMLSGHR